MTFSAHLQRTSLTIAAAVVVVFTLLGASVAPADAQVDGRAQPTDRIERVRLGCQATNIDGERGIACRWSEAENPNVRAYRLLKITNGSPRELVATVRAGGRLGHFDTTVEAPSEITYGVVAVNRSGRLIGRSAPVTVQFGTVVD
jgi:hypothetical protein